jgi:hypothetical protein
MTEPLSHLLLKIPRNTEVTPEAAQTFLATLTQINSTSGLGKLRGKHTASLALEIILKNQQIHFQVSCDKALVPFIEAQLRSSYPLVIIEPIQDQIDPTTPLHIKEHTLKKGNFYPLATYNNFTDIDPLSSILTILTKADPQEISILQFALQSTSTRWQTQGQSYADHGTKNEDGTYSPHPDSSIIKEKISYPGFLVSLRSASTNPRTLTEITSALGVFTRSDGNSFTTKKGGLLGSKNKLKRDFFQRVVTDKQVINIIELATLWHLPSEKVKTASIAWGTSVLSEPPGNLPISSDKTDEEKLSINFFAKTQFKNKNTTFGIKNTDRRRHIWIVGKTGTGKSTMMQNMVIDDIKKGRGMGLIDPHGDGCETILNYIPSNRINDVIYFNPADKDRPIAINPLEVVNHEEAELVVSGLMAVFTKIWANVWSARMEYILRNSFLTLAQIEGTMFEDVLKLLANKNYRRKILDQITDKSLVHFWLHEYEKMPDRLQKEAISPIQNKVGQFVTSPMIRKIIGHPKSTVQLDQAMNSGKIFLANLSQGRLGEDNAALLGAVLITKFQLAAMRRVEIEEDQRKDFFLYVDEFQNFATESRKYRLNLTLANQYMAQIPEEVQKAILGNVGSLVCFAIGAEDASIVHKEFAEVFEENDLVNLDNFQIATKLMVDGQSSRPFLANTLPLPASINKNKSKVISVSQEYWGIKNTPYSNPQTQTHQ